MQYVFRRRHRGRFYASQALIEREPTGILPSFSKAMGLDFIVTPEGKVVLIELQHGFGRRGLVELFPHTHRKYRQNYWSLRRQFGKSFLIIDGLRKICSDKIRTYKLLAPYQPSSFVYRKWNARVENWLDSLRSDFILAKPSQGSCGKGIRVFGRHDFRRSQGKIALGQARLLQEYIESRPLVDSQGKTHVGCIRHIVLLYSEGPTLSFLHLPSYWRVSPVPFVEKPDYEACTANISRGAYPVAVDLQDQLHIRQLAELICHRLIQTIVQLPQLDAGCSDFIPQVGA
jgi:hypothetical protein